MLEVCKWAKAGGEARFGPVFVARARPCTCVTLRTKPDALEMKAGGKDQTNQS